MKSSLCWCSNHMVVVVLLLTSCPTTNSQANGSSYDSDKMYLAVWGGYQQAVRPMCSIYPDTTTVSIGIALRQIQELNEPKQILTTNLWLRVTWSDCRLTWNTNEWNASRLIVPYNTVWTPDLTLYDNAEGGQFPGKDNYRIVVGSDGTVEQFVPLVVQSLCLLDVTRFPFDTQECNLTFGSWAYHGLEVNLTHSANPADLSSYVTHTEWEVLSLTAQRIEPYFSGVPYPQVIFTLVLRRRHLFYILSLLFPVALIQLMAALGFLLPCDANEKVGLEITVLLSLAVMQLVILDMIPASSETFPLIGLYFMLGMITVSLSCVSSVIVLAVYYPSVHRPLPPWPRALLQTRVAKWFGIDSSSIMPDNKRTSAGSAWPGHNSTSSRRDGSRKNKRGIDIIHVHPLSDVSGHTSTVIGDVIGHTSAGFGDVRRRSDVIRHLPEGRNDSRQDCARHDQTDIVVEGVVEGVGGDPSNNGRGVYRPDRADAQSTAVGYRGHQNGNQRRDNASTTFSQPHEDNGDFALEQVLTVCRQILEETRYGKEKRESRSEDSAQHKLAKRQWQMFALFLDRIFLIMYCLLTIFTFTYVYASIA